MAEKINWTNVANQVIHGVPPRPWQRVDFGRFVPNVSKVGEVLRNAADAAHPFASKVGEVSLNVGKITANIGKEWVLNLNPIGREKLWYFGFALGVGESIAVMPLRPFGAGWARGVGNAAVMQVFYIAARGDIDKKEKIMTVFKGISAGAVYGSLGFSLLEDTIQAQLSNLAGKLAEDHSGTIVPTFEPTHTPVPEPAAVVPTAPEGVIQSPAIPGTEGQADILADRAKEIANAYSDKSAEAVEAALKEKAAAVVGEHLAQTNELANEAIKAAGMDPHQLSAEAYEKVRMAVQSELENKANGAFASATGDNLDTIINSGHDAFAQSIDPSDVISHDHFIDIGKEALVHLQPDHALGEVNNVIHLGSVLNPDLATSIDIDSGSTIGQLLVDHGNNLTWGAADADVLGANLAANYDLINNYWGEVAAAQNWPDNIHFPVGFSDLHSVIEQAKNGDPEALQKLKDALRWVPAHKKFQILSKLGIKEVTEVLANIA